MMDVHRVHSTGGGYPDGWHIYIGDEIVICETILGIESQLQKTENWLKSFPVICALASVGGEHTYDERGFWLVDLGEGPPPHEAPRERIWIDGYEAWRVNK